MVLCTKDKKTHEDSSPVLYVLLVEKNGVCSGCIVRLCRSVRLLLVACCLLLVAKNYEVRFGFVKSFCKTFCTFFVRMVVAAGSVFFCH